METNEVRVVEVYAGQLWQATMIKNILEDSQIKAFLENELMGTVAPWRVSAGGFDPVKVMVLSTDYEQAINIINDFNRSEPEITVED